MFFSPQMAEAIDASSFAADEIAGRLRSALHVADERQLERPLAVWPGSFGPAIGPRLVVVGLWTLGVYASDGPEIEVPLAPLRSAEQLTPRRLRSLGLTAGLGPVSVSVGPGRSLSIGLSAPLGLASLGVEAEVVGAGQRAPAPNVALRIAGSRRRAGVYVGWPERSPARSEVDHFVRTLNRAIS